MSLRDEISEFSAWWGGVLIRIYLRLCGRCLLLLWLPYLCGCAALQEPRTPANDSTGRALQSNAHPAPTVIGENAEVAVVKAMPGDSFESLATRYYGDPKMAWLLREENKFSTVNQGDVVVIHKRHTNSIGLANDTIQAVPILSYHRFGDTPSPMSVPESRFRQQLQLLKDEGYQVIPLAWLTEFLDGRRPLPRKAVLLTIDDGYRSAYNVAFPLLKEFGFPATIFIYSDFIQNGGLSWKQMEEMIGSGLISIQAHAKTHRNLVRLRREEPNGEALGEELDAPRKRLQRLRQPIYALAYPYGATDPGIMGKLEQYGYTLGLSVDRGSNPFFADRLNLRRTMIYHDDDLATFRKALITSENLR